MTSLHSRQNFQIRTACMIFAFLPIQTASSLVTR